MSKISIFLRTIPYSKLQYLHRALWKLAAISFYFIRMRRRGKKCFLRPLEPTEIFNKTNDADSKIDKFQGIQLWQNRLEDEKTSVTLQLAFNWNAYDIRLTTFRMIFQLSGSKYHWTFNQFENWRQVTIEYV